MTKTRETPSNVPRSNTADGIQSQLFHRSVDRLVDKPIGQGMTPEHRARHLIEPGSWAAIDPFLVLAEDWFPRGVFHSHPHRGLETVTIVLEGRLDHEDNRGNQGSIKAGDAQWMTAGRGIIHNEVPAQGQTVHSLQLWVNLPAAEKMTDPRYQDLLASQMPVRREPGVEIRVFSGASGDAKAPTLNHVPVKLLSIRLEPGASLTEAVPSDYNGFILVLEGEGEVGDDRASVSAGQLAWLTRDADKERSDVTLHASGGSLHALLVAGRPLREPVVARGPFVMNTAEQVADAYRDYRAGKFTE